MGFYRIIKILEYETANPGQDFNEKEAEKFNVDEDPNAPAGVTPATTSAGGAGQSRFDGSFDGFGQGGVLERGIPEHGPLHRLSIAGIGSRKNSVAASQEPYTKGPDVEAGKRRQDSV